MAALSNVNVFGLEIPSNVSFSMLQFLTFQCQCLLNQSLKTVLIYYYTAEPDKLCNNVPNKFQRNFSQNVDNISNVAVSSSQVLQPTVGESDKRSD